VAKAKKLAAEVNRPDLLAGIADGTVNATSALRQLEEQKKKENLFRKPKVELPHGLHHGDFRQLSKQIPDESVELIFTDPPYDGDSVPLYGDAAEIAARILKPGGSFIAYSSHAHLPDVLNACREYLRYFWIMACVHSGGKTMMQHQGIRPGWKPMVWFVKGTRGDNRNVMSDTVTGGREKDHHEWQQAEAEAEYVIEKLTSPNGTVVDFFLGGGTTAVAAKKLGRKWIGFEIDAAAAEKAAKRIG
jgi:DNA modification methylase